VFSFEGRGFFSFFFLCVPPPLEGFLLGFLNTMGVAVWSLDQFFPIAAMRGRAFAFELQGSGSRFLFTFIAEGTAGWPAWAHADTLSSRCLSALGLCLL